MRALMLTLATGAAALLISCGSEPAAPAPAKPATTAAVAKPPDESRRFPIAGRLDTQVVDNHLLDKPFMPGTLARYKKGKTEYSMFIAKLAAAQDAAFLLLDWNKALTGSKLEPGFGGYFGLDGARPVFVFTKGAWIAGIAGLPERDADLAARTLAMRLD